MDDKHALLIRTEKTTAWCNFAWM